jgi:hypothetical protein
MNYKKIHDNIIDRAKNRNYDGYTENHHIIPICMGGTNDKDNMVKLTPEEHFLIHILLVKLNPQNDSLIFAVKMMTEHQTNKRMNNKLYGYLKKRHSEACSKRTKNMWKEKREDIVASMKISFNTQENRRKRSIGSKKSWNKDDGTRKAQIMQLQKDYNKETAIKNKEKWKCNEFKEKMKKRKKRGSDGSNMKKYWNDPIWKEKVLSDRKKRRELNEANKNK